MYNALMIAKYIICHCRETGRPVSNLKLQKLLYFVQAEFLVSTGYPCFFNRIEAWELGPVVPDVYHEYKAYGSGVIILTLNCEVDIPQKDQKIIDRIVDLCNQFTASSLVELTHRQTPWINAKRSGYNTIISNESIREFFKN